MADLFCHFSAALNVGVENRQAALDLYTKLIADDDDKYCLAELREDPDDAGSIWFVSGEGGHPEHVARFVLICAEIFALQGRWGMTWSYTCSRPIASEIGGGAFVLDLTHRRVDDYADLHEWLERRLASTSPHSCKVPLPDYAEKLIREEDSPFLRWRYEKILSVTLVKPNAATTGL